MNQTLKKNRIPLILAAMIGLLFAMWAGLFRMGWAIPPLQPMLAGAHGPLMISGFLGTLIGLERAVGLGVKWTYAAPILTGVGGLILISGLSDIAGAGLITAGSLGLVAIFLYIIRHQPLLHQYTMLVGAFTYFVGNLLWLFGQPISNLVAWWAGFLILTIAGERLELSRLVRVSDNARNLFIAIIALYLGGAVTIMFSYATGWRITGAAMLALSFWLLRQDIARRTIKQAGLTRFIATCMLSGYVWLGIAGVLAMIYGFLFGGPYDAVLHSVFLGFVFTMIFGHAPVIFPAVLNVQIPFRPAFYVHLGALHLSLIVRVAAGVLEWYPGRLWGAMLNVIALLLFIFNTAYAA
ncbi:MAG TPA: hypothetical protein VD902_09145, partial [Symbiobacteriaceae bacterium]|nr:hypothetical protein [Symbiobacteriaceae bacterium]